jgi:hypothetical protein
MRNTDGCAALYSWSATSLMKSDVDVPEFISSSMPSFGPKMYWLT